jgi:hypothetical protein
MSNDNRDFVKRSWVAFENNDVRNALLCPCCGSSYLHHEFIDVYERAIEDGPTWRGRIMGIEVVENVGQVKCSPFAPMVMDAENPSRRRDGIRIYFRCEDCDASVHLTIAQHKGCSFLEMEHVEHGRFLER